MIDRGDLLNKLETLWTGYLKQAYVSQIDCISVSHLGVLLRIIAGKQLLTYGAKNSSQIHSYKNCLKLVYVFAEPSAKETGMLTRPFSEQFKTGQPNLIVVPASKKLNCVSKNTSDLGMSLFYHFRKKNYKPK